MVRNLVRVGLFTVCFQLLAKPIGVFIAGGFAGALFASVLLVVLGHFLLEFLKRLVFRILLKGYRVNALAVVLLGPFAFVLLVLVLLSLGESYFPALVATAGFLPKVVFALVLGAIGALASIKLKERQSISLGKSRVSKRELRKLLRR
ncbi:MAG: hypothetical protein HY986_10800 [Candidatus Melainabacteria bacterium]|nr:hypothetical protein [Candidatus Melainabacteria bacterium]